VKTTGLAIPNGDPVPHLKSLWFGQGNLLLAEIPIHGQGRRHAFGLAQDRLALGPTDGHERMQVKRVVHDKFARPNLNHASSQPSNVINRRLQSTVVTSDNITLFKPNVDQRPLLHL
jgi:hypothetical protein